MSPGQQRLHSEPLSQEKRMKENKDALKALQEFVSPDPLQSQKHTSVNLFISFSLEIECHLKTLFIQVHSGDVFLYLDAKYSNTTSV